MKLPNYSERWLLRLKKLCQSRSLPDGLRISVLRQIQKVLEVCRKLKKEKGNNGC